MPSESKISVAERIGLAGYSSSLSGIGGIIKIRAVDFRVEEFGRKISFDPKGRFTVAKITLNNWETNRFIGKLARILKISRNRIWFSGTKDKRAVTQQIFVIDSPESNVSSVEIKDVDIQILGRSHQKLNFGEHQGNRFSIVVRGCAHPDGSPMKKEDAFDTANKIIVELESNLGKGIIPNWIGPQRFGGTRGVTSEVGKRILEGDFESAVNTYIGMEGTEEEDEVKDFRKSWRDNGNPEELLENIPKRLSFEGEMVKHLAKKGEDWVGAFKKLPGNLQLMCIHAAQSEAFNKILAKRIEKKMSLCEPYLGDVVQGIGTNGKIIKERIATVDEQNMKRITLNCKKNRLIITGALPGSDYLLTEGKPRDIEMNVIEKMELDKYSFMVEEIPRLSSKGTRRPLVTRYGDITVEVVENIELNDDSMKWSNGPKLGDRWHPDGSSIRFRFSLPPGSYATIIMREFMQSPLTHY